MKDFFDEMLQKTMDILAIDTVQSTACEASPFGKGVGDCIESVLQTAKSMGFSVHNENGYYGTADIGEGEEFGILGHLDVVPYGKDWSANPLGEIKDGKIFGRGILDDKGPMMCCLYACHELLQAGYKPTHKIRFIFGGNEESGWRCIDRYNQVDIMPTMGFSPDGDFPVINCEKGLVNYEIIMPKPANLVSIEGGERANIVMPYCKAVIDKPLLAICYNPNVNISFDGNQTVVEAFGKPAHASTPSKGINAFWSVMEYLSSALGGEYTNIFKKLCHNDGKPINLALHDEKSGTLTFNVGISQCIDIQNKQALSLVIDIRYPITFNKLKIKSILESVLNTKYVRIIHYHDPHYIDPKDPLVTKLLDSYNKVTKQNAQPISIGGGTYARALKKGVAFGPIFPGQESSIHQKDEHCNISDYRKMYDIYLNAIKSLLFT